MPQNIGINFNGQHLIHPQARARINASALNGVGSSESPRLVLVGRSIGGEPGVIHWFDNPSDAKSEYIGGDLVEASRLAWMPSGEFTGAGTIGLLRAQNASQSNLTVGSLKLTSKGYGSYTTRVQAKVEDGSFNGSKKLTVYYWPDNKTEVYDNLGPIFTVQYVGPQAYATLSIDHDENDKATKLSIKVGEDEATATELLSYNLGDGEFTSVNQIVYDINEHADFEAAMITYGNKNVRSDALDMVSNVDIKQSATVNAINADFILETKYSQLVEVSFSDNQPFTDNFEFTYLTGGSDGEVPASWSDLLNNIYGERAYIVVPLTSDQAVHSEVLGFINNQSNNEGQRMISVFGGDLDESLEQTITRALTLSSSRAILAYPGIKVSDVDGSVRTLPSYFTAAMIAGLIVGSGMSGDPITMDSVNCLDLEKNLTSSEKDRLLQAGVTILEKEVNHIPTTFRVVQGITTYQINGNPAYREISVRISADDLLSSLEYKLNAFIGTRGNIQSMADILNAVQSTLDDKVDEGQLVSYVAESVVVTLKDDHVDITFDAMPAGAINYITLTASYVSQTLQMSSTNTLGNTLG